MEPCQPQSGIWTWFRNSSFDEEACDLTDCGQSPRSKGTSLLKWKYMKTYMCAICGFVYAEELGLPEAGIAPGTAWSDVPEDWACPDCGSGKADFEMTEI